MYDQYLTALFFAFPALKFGFTKEGYFIEITTVFLSILTIYTAVQIFRYTKNTFIHGQSIFLGLIVFLLIAEETGFGHSLFSNYRRPKILDVPIDSLHDMVDVLIKIFTDFPGTQMFYGTLAVLLAIFIMIIFVYIKNYESINRFIRSRTFILTVIAFVLLITATIFDSHLFEPSISMRYFEELFEFLGAFTIWSAAQILWKNFVTVSYTSRKIL